MFGTFIKNFIKLSLNWICRIRWNASGKLPSYQILLARTSRDLGMLWQVKLVTPQKLVKWLKVVKIVRAVPLMNLRITSVSLLVHGLLACGPFNFSPLSVQMLPQTAFSKKMQNRHCHCWCGPPACDPAATWVHLLKKLLRHSPCQTLVHQVAHSSLVGIYHAWYTNIAWWVHTVRASPTFCSSAFKPDVHLLR